LFRTARRMDLKALLPCGGRGRACDRCPSQLRRCSRLKPEGSPQGPACASAPRSSSGAPRQIVGQHIYHDRRQAQRHPDPEHRRMVDASPVARRRCGLHLITSSVRRMSSMNDGGLIKSPPILAIPADARGITDLAGPYGRFASGDFDRRESEPDHQILLPKKPMRGCCATRIGREPR
jgi:hypothetical protein